MRSARHKNGLTKSEYEKLKDENTARKRGLTISEYRRLNNEKTAINRGKTLSEYQNKLQLKRAKENNMTLKEYFIYCENNASKRQGLSRAEYKKEKNERLAKSKGYDNFNEYNKHHKFCREYFECSKEEYYATLETAKNLGFKRVSSYFKSVGEIKKKGSKRTYRKKEKN